MNITAWILSGLAKIGREINASSIISGMTESFVKIIRKNAFEVSRVRSVKAISFCMPVIWVVEEYFSQTLHITVFKDFIFDFAYTSDTLEMWKFVFNSMELVSLSLNQKTLYNFREWYSFYVAPYELLFLGSWIIRIR